MKFEIDVAGYDMFGDRDFTICIAKEDGSIVKGFKYDILLALKGCLMATFAFGKSEVSMM